MQLVVCVLNKTNVLENILKNLSAIGINGATVLNSKGMAHILSESEDFRFMESLIKFLDPENSESKTFFVVSSDEKTDEVISVIDTCVGGIDKPDTGIVFTLPVLRTAGMGKNRE